MGKPIEGRVRYDEATDSFVYEILSDGEWGMVQGAKCVKREGADEREETAFIHYSLLQRIVHDVSTLGVHLN